MPKKTTINKEKPEFIYTIKDKSFPDFSVLDTANAWWLERTKVTDLISAFKIDSTIEEACVFSGISVKQYKYFLGKHPDFSTVKDNCKNLPILKARKTVNDNIDNSYNTGMDYLKRKRRLEFGDNIDHTSGGEKLKVTFDESFNKDKKK